MNSSKLIPDELLKLNPGDLQNGLNKLSVSGKSWNKIKVSNEVDAYTESAVVNALKEFSVKEIVDASKPSKKILEEKGDK